MRLSSYLRDTGFNGRHIGIVLGVGLLAACLLVTLRGPQGIGAFFELSNEIRGLQRQNADIEKEIADKRDRLRRLDSSAGERELEVKKRLKYLKPGETQMVMPENAPASK